MKRFTKLLSVILAVIMACSCLSAAVAASAVDYTKVKDFRLSADESATLLLDYVDDMLAKNAETSDDHGKFEYSLNLGLVKIDILLDYSSIDKALSTLVTLLDKYYSKVKGMLGDAKNIDYSMLKGVQRKGGDLNVVYALLQFLDKNSNLVEKVVKGNLSLGTIVNGFFDVNAKISEVIGNFTDGEANDVPTLAKYFLYKALLADKFGHAASWKKDGGATADAILNTFINAYATSEESGSGCGPRW